MSLTCTFVQVTYSEVVTGNRAGHALCLAQANNTTTDDPKGKSKA
jgi:hypothetical protein